MANGNRASAHIDLILFESQHVHAGESLCGEGFVQFNQVDIFQRKPRAPQCFLRGWYWAGPHYRRIDADHRRGDYAHQGLETQLGGLVL
jgi:hypothetical protein